MPNKTKIEGIVDAVQDAILFFKDKWRATLLTTLFLIFVIFIGLVSFYGYKRIASMDNKIDELNPSPERMQEFLEETTEQNKLIMKVLSTDLLTHGGDRSYLLRFHNGQKDINGTHFMYLSMSNEAMVDNIGSGFANWQDVPTALIPAKWIDDLLAGSCYHLDPMDVDGHEVIRRKMLSSGTKKVLLCPVNDLETGNLLGVVGITWVTDYPDPEKCEMVHRDIEIAASKLSAILSIND